MAQLNMFIDYLNDIVDKPVVKCNLIFMNEILLNYFDTHFERIAFDFKLKHNIVNTIIIKTGMPHPQKVTI